METKTLIPIGSTVYRDVAGLEKNLGVVIKYGEYGGCTHYIVVFPTLFGLAMAYRQDELTVLHEPYYANGV